MLLLPDVDDIYDVAGEVEVDGGLCGATCDVCCLCLPSFFFAVVVVVVGSSNDATTSFFGPAAHAAQNEILQKERKGRIVRGEGDRSLF